MAIRQDCNYRCNDDNNKYFHKGLNKFLPCPLHGHIKVNEDTKFERLNGKTFREINNLPEWYDIPPIVDEELYGRQVKITYTDSSIYAHMGLLKKINNSVFNGNIFNLSCYIHAPNLIDIEDFVYSVQKTAIEKGMSTVPYIGADILYGLRRAESYSLRDLEDAAFLSRVLNCSGRDELYSVDMLKKFKIDAKNDDADTVRRKAVDGLRRYPDDILYCLRGYEKRLSLGLTYKDYASADIVFINTGVITTTKCWEVISDLLQIRGMNGLPTYIIGYWRSNSYRIRKEIINIINDKDRIKLNQLVVFDLVAKNIDDYNEAARQDLEKVKERKAIGAKVGFKI